RNVTGVQMSAIPILSLDNLGTESIFVGIIIGLLSTEVIFNLIEVKALKINLGYQVPPAVGAAFSLLIPVVITISVFSLISVLLVVTMGTDLINLIIKFIQAPLRGIGTSLVGYLFLYSLGNLLYILGIHQSVIH